MEYQGIITGIGDKDENINIITPEIDAVLNDYIIGKNAVIEGLEVSGYDTLTAGMCVLKGYKGVLPNAITVGAGTNGNYIYGKFVLNFNNTVDEFYIEVTNDVHTSPASITNAGTYYLLLYYFEGGDWVPALDVYDNLYHNYPNKAFEADETGVLLDYGVIAPTTETETADENAHLTTPLRVANTEYVHNQIEEEIAYASETISFRTENNYSPNSYISGTLTLTHKAKYIIGATATITGNIYGVGGALPTSIGVLPAKFRPISTALASIKCQVTETSELGTNTYDIYLYIRFNTNGNITLVDTITPTYGITREYKNATVVIAGYETN